MIKPAALALTVILGGLAAAPAAAVEQDPLRARHGVGLSLSKFAGAGLTYFRTFENGLGFHVAGTGWGAEDQHFANLGGAVTAEFYRSGPLTAYGLLSAGAQAWVFPGGHGLNPTLTPQLFGGPGLGLTFGPFFLEGAVAFYHAGQWGYAPAVGGGLVWWL